MANVIFSAAARAVLRAFHCRASVSDAAIIQHSKKKTPPSGWLGRVKMLGGVPPLPVKMKLNCGTISRGMIEMKPAATMIHGISSSSSPSSSASSVSASSRCRVSDRGATVRNSFCCSFVVSLTHVWGHFSEVFLSFDRSTEEQFALRSLAVSNFFPSTFSNLSSPLSSEKTICALPRSILLAFTAPLSSTKIRSWSAARRASSRACLQLRGLASPRRG